MFEQYQRQLSSSDVLQRRQAIVKITNSGHPDAQMTLERMLYSETDSEVKALVQKALQYLRTMHPTPDTQTIGTIKPLDNNQSYGSVSPFETGKQRNVTTGKPAPALPLNPNFLGMGKPAPVSEQKKKIAKGHLDAATQHRFNGKTDKAILELRKAVQADPELGTQPFVIGLAAALVGGSSDPIQTVLGHTEVKDENLAVTGTVTIGMFLLEMAVIVVAYVLVSAITYRKSIEMLTQLTAVAPADYTASILTLLDSFYKIGRDQLVIGTVVQAITLTVSNLIFSFVLYVVGVFVGGSGGLLNFLRTSMRAQAIIAVLSGILFLITPITAFTTPSSTTQAVMGLYAALGIGGLIAWVYFSARAHNFGFFRGCVMVILTGIALSILSYMLTAAAVRNMMQDPNFTNLGGYIITMGR